MSNHRKDLKPVEGLAVIVYGALAILLPGIASIFFEVKLAVIGFSVTAAATYLYQDYLFGLPDDWVEQDEMVAAYGAVAIFILWAASLLAFVFGS